MRGAPRAFVLLSLLGASACLAGEDCPRDSLPIDETLDESEIQELLDDVGESTVTGSMCGRICQRAGELKHDYDYVWLDEFGPECFLSSASGPEGSLEGDLSVRCTLIGYDACMQGA